MAPRRSAIVLTLLLLTGSEVVGSAEIGPLKLQSALQALDIARLAAENGLEELSLRAFRKALSGGPPVDVDNPDDIQSSVRVIERRQAELDLLWRQQNFSADQTYQAMVSVVLPDLNRSAVHVYTNGGSDDATLLPTTDSIGHRMLLWAQRSGQLDDLRSRLESRISNNNSTALLILKAKLALLGGDIAEIESSLQHLNHPNSWQLSDDDLRGLLQIVTDSMQSGIAVELCMPIIERVTDEFVNNSRQTNSGATTSQRMESASTMLLALAELRLRQGNKGAAADRLQTYLQLTEGQNSRHSGRSQSQLRYARLQLAAGVYLRNDALPEAILLLEKAVGEVPVMNGTQTVRTTQALVRTLAGRSPVDRYEQLRRVCLPQDRSAAISLMSAPQPGAEPGDSSSLVIGTGLQLLTTAEQLGKLPELIAELQDRHLAKATNGRTLLAMAYCLASMPEQAAPLMEEQVEAIGYDTRTRQKSRDSFSDLLLCQQALQHRSLIDVGCRLASEIKDYNAQVGVPLVTELSHALKLSGVLPIPSKGLPAGWISGQCAAFHLQEFGVAKPSWLNFGGVISHYGGSGTDCLYLPFPLTGEFEFSVETLADEGQVSAVGYGGVLVESRHANDSVTVSDVARQTPQNTWASSARTEDFNRTEIRLTAAGPLFSVNGGPTFQDTVDAFNSSPWVFLAAASNQRGTWRFPQLKGNPTIPREVRLSSDFRLRGWSSAAFGESRCSPWKPGDSHRDSNTRSSTTPHWCWKDGVITGKRGSHADAATFSEYIQSHLLNRVSHRLLQYDRPLVSGDTIRWEFEFQPNSHNVAPALGRTVFLMEPGGVTTHQLSAMDDLSTAADYGIAASESTATDSDRPLVNTGWNTASLHIFDNRLTLIVNNQSAMDATFDSDIAHSFGFYHDSRQYAARIRNVVLTGNWPQTVPADFMTPASFSFANAPEVKAAIGEEAFVRTPAAIVEHARALSEAQRFKYLRSLLFSDAGTKLAAIRADVVEDTNANGETVTALVSPVLQLVETADRVGKLNELREQLATLSFTKSEPDVARWQLLALLAIKANDLRSASSYINTAARQAEQTVLKASVTKSGQRWIDLMVAEAALRHEPLWADAIRLVSFDGHAFSPASRYRRYLEGELQKRISGKNGKTVNDWNAVIHSTAETHGVGLPVNEWTQMAPDTIEHWPGGDDNRLLMPVPLIGDFVFEAEVSVSDQNAIEIGYNATSFSFPLDNKRQILSKRFGKRPRRHWQATALEMTDRVRCRIQVTGSQLTAYANGQQVITTELPVTGDPWLFLKADAVSMGRVSGLRLDGSPTVPESYLLDTSPWMHGWSADYYGEATGVGKPWSAADGTISADQNASAGLFCESLLRYHRPLWGSCRVDYEFFFRPNDQLVHPAVGRTVYLLDDLAGVAVHELSDSRFETGDNRADGRRVFPSRRQTDALPLQDNAWNHVSISITDNVLTLSLNDVVVYVDPLQNGSDRIFGLFHYKEQTAVRARNFRMTGDWPRTIPEQLRGSP